MLLPLATPAGSEGPGLLATRLDKEINVDRGGAALRARGWALTQTMFCFTIVFKDAVPFLIQLWYRNNIFVETKRLYFDI